MGRGVVKLDNLAAERISAGHTVTTLAQVACVSDRTIQILENGGEVEHHIAQQIADALGVTLVTLGEREI